MSDVKIVKLPRRNRDWLNQVVRELTRDGIARRTKRSLTMRSMEQWGLIEVKWAAPPMSWISRNGMPPEYFRVFPTEEGLRFVNPRLAALYLLGRKGRPVEDL